MNCPKCKSDNTAVLETRSTGGWSKRRRRCDDCREKFTTLEIVVDSGEHSWHELQVLVIPNYEAKEWRRAMLSMAEALGKDPT